MGLIYDRRTSRHYRLWVLNLLWPMFTPLLSQKITSVNDKTISCVPVINRVVKGSSKQLPEFIEVPPVILQGGDSYIAEPIAAGDYCLVLISERCYDAWYAGSDFVSPLEMRMHDYSDGFALCGVNPQATAINIPKKNRMMKGGF